MDEVSKDGPVFDVVRSRERGFWSVGAKVLTAIERHVDNGASAIAALTNKSLLAGSHAGEVVRHKEELDCGFVRIFDDDLELPLLGNAIGAQMGLPCCRTRCFVAMKGSVMFGMRGKSC